MMLETFKSDILPIKNKLYRYAYSILVDHDLSKDVVQETMIKVWEKREELSSIKNKEAWCITIARNFSLDKLRSRHHQTLNMEMGYDKENDHPSPYMVTEIGDTMEILKGIVKNLPFKQKEVFQLRDIEGLSYQEISEITGFGLSDVKISIFRARQTIRNVLSRIQKHGLEKCKSAL